MATNKTNGRIHFRFSDGRQSSRMACQLRGIPYFKSINVGETVYIPFKREVFSCLHSLHKLDYDMEVIKRVSLSDAEYQQVLQLCNFLAMDSSKIRMY